MIDTKLSRLVSKETRYTLLLSHRLDLFEKYSRDNVLIMANKTVAYIGRMD